ncbi:MAG: stalk domain-containing protein [Clostridia bacterium]|nr:stalk domain-containing protein [Clostridia bacterium]
MKKLTRKFILILMILIPLSIFSIKELSIAQAVTKYQYPSIHQNVRVKLDGHILNFDVSPIIIDGRTLVPFRVILETLGAKVGWHEDTRTVTAIKDDLIIELKIDSVEALLNKEKIDLDVPAMIKDGRTLIPVRFIAEALGCTVDWDVNSRTVMITSPSIGEISMDREFSFQGIGIGDTEGKIINILGEPARKDLSKYGFKWYIYNGDYSKYIQVGIKNNRVVGIYTNASNWESKEGIKIGTRKREVNNRYGTALTGIKKGNTIYKLESSEADTYLIDDYYVTIFYDFHRGNTVTAILLIEKETEEALNSFFGKTSSELKKSYERQIFDLANAIRARFNKAQYRWDDKISSLAREHSKDMADKNYFSHENLKGKSPFDRMEDNNIDFTRAAENIAAGQPNAIFAHENWMNSKGHRQNILGECEVLGVGVYFGGKYKIYYTQNFCTISN